jgi:hypothetical protein
VELKRKGKWIVNPIIDCWVRISITEPGRVLEVLATANVGKQQQQKLGVY